ncbi:MAG: GntR family transcriptional regulator [Actinobacteria bacterium]|nr:GntR family transcriptional regulator [Actinomycetota bacterium]
MRDTKRGRGRSSVERPSGTVPSTVPHTQSLRQQVRLRVTHLLAERRLRPGEQIPTEPELIELLGVSRATLREGLQLLEQEGVLASRHGVGRFVVAPPDTLALDISHLRGVSEVLKEHRIRARVRLLDASRQPADAAVAGALHVSPGIPVIRLERVWADRANPVIYSVDILPEALIGDGWTARDFEGSLLELLESRSGRVLGHAESVVRAVTLPPALARRVGVPANVAWLRMDQVNFDTGGQPIIYSQDYHRGDWITFQVVRFRR